MLSINSVSAGLVAAFVAAIPFTASAATVNFETGYTDNQQLGDPVTLLDSTGAASIVSLSTTNANTMSIEARGNSDATLGFVNDVLGGGDVEATGETASLGNFFLRTTSALSGDYSQFNPVFTLTFAGGASSVSGQLWDIDGTSSDNTEQWEVVATLVGGGMQTLTSPLGDSNGATSLDGRPWDFAFNTAGNDIAFLDFKFTGSKTSGIGAAFDNLNVSQVPLPAGGLLLLCGLAGLGAMRRRKLAK